MQVLFGFCLIILLSTLLSVTTSSAEVASSRSKIGASRSTARAIEIRWACPSEKPNPLAPTFVLIPSGKSFINSYAQATSSASIISSSVASSLTIRKFSAIVPEKIVFPCGTYEKYFLVDAFNVTSLPSLSHNTASPELGIKRPKNILISVVFPWPEGPTSATISFRFASNEDDFITCFSLT